MIKTFAEALANKLPVIRAKFPELATEVNAALEDPASLDTKQKRVLLGRVNDAIAVITQSTINA